MKRLFNSDTVMTNALLGFPHARKNENVKNVFEYALRCLDYTHLF